jgi:hypothetical protein
VNGKRVPKSQRKQFITNLIDKWVRAAQEKARAQQHRKQ